jgi:glycosyltransferase involved in cell wall biosynthesis
MKVAIVHDWLVTYAGAERVLEQIVGLYPDADLFSVVDFLPAQQRHCIKHKKVTTTFIQNLPFSRKYYRHFLPLMPLAIEQLDLSSYDLVISSSHAVAKGVLTGPDQLHVCLCYSPIRYAWDLQHQYLKETGLNHGVKGLMAKSLLHYIRMWDYRTANGVDEFIAISAFVGRRIRKVYGRESTVIYPPVDVERFTLHEAKEDYYITASRLVPYKRVDLIVEAFAQMPDKKLVVIGDGPEMAKIRSLAGKNVEILGQQPFEVLLAHLQRAKAFVFAVEEDFGIAPLEAQACGTPVIAYGKGGVLETIRGLETERPTGVFFGQQEVQAVVAAIAQFERHRAELFPENCRENALRFTVENFRDQFRTLVDDQVKSFQMRKISGNY